MTYNLLDEPWIPVLRTNGRVNRVGIRAALTEAKNIRQIVASSPMDRFAILRFLLAMKYWCEGAPSLPRADSSTASLSPGGLSKLDGKREDFDLFGKDRRFYQFGGGCNSRLLSANYLLHEIPTGTNFSHFRHSRDDEDGLCPACCAMGLVRLPVFTTMGGRGQGKGGQGKGPGINMAPPIYAIPLGESLFQTLGFSWVPVSDLGNPAWEVPDAPLPPAGAIPLLIGLTWLPRRVWLEEPGNIEKCCISCGRKERLVLRTVFEGRGKTRPGTWHDPHSLPKVGKGSPSTGLHALDTVKKSDAAAGQWISIVEALLSKKPLSFNGGAPPSWYVVAFSTDQNKYLEAVEWLVPPNPSPGTKDALADALKRWERRWDSPALLKKLFPEVKGPRRDGEGKRLRSLLDSVHPHAEQEIGVHAMACLKDERGVWEPPMESYRSMSKLISGSLFPGPTILAVEMRKHIGEDFLLMDGVAKAKRPRTHRRRSAL